MSLCYNYFCVPLCPPFNPNSSAHLIFSLRSNFKVEEDLSKVHNFFGLRMYGDSSRHCARCSVLRTSTLM
jgi:hypothetical protein